MMTDCIKKHIDLENAELMDDVYIKNKAMFDTLATICKQARTLDADLVEKLLDFEEMLMTTFSDMRELYIVGMRTNCSSCAKMKCVKNRVQNIS